MKSVLYFSPYFSIQKQKKHHVHKIYGISSVGTTLEYPDKSLYGNNR
ncbi:hypothetical protein BACCOP_00757 [Phocaeicola coprocola DSM 17136]|uniref:Uncharacterized protein n=1 Tax=Phocaeicola coprocola DSM 17136 TaxID=470145 RepID=B3JFV6_9BACT|nr:hypothetical protein BACCOP_00757 [Phocaeicola coprocola DSM 17136]